MTQIPDLGALVKPDALKCLEDKVDALAAYGETAPKPNKTARGPVPTPPVTSEKRKRRRAVRAARRANR